MDNNPTIEVSLKGQEATNQIFLSPIENFPYIKEKNLYLSLEYYICTGISVFLWSYFTTSAGFLSYSFTLKKKIVNTFAYLSKYRDLYDHQWRFFTTNKLIFLFFTILFIILSKTIKKANINLIKYFYILSGLCFCFFIIQLRMIYLLCAGCIFYYTKTLINLGEKTYMVICWSELFFVKYLIKFIQSQININYLNSLQFKNSIDDLSWEIVLIYSLLRMISFNFEYKKVYYNESVAESIFNLNQAKSHCMECYDGNFCSKCLDNTVIGEKDKIDENFNLIDFLAYVFYPPLLLAGPLINYNSFVFQLNAIKDSQHNILIKMNKILYLLKLIFFYTVMEIYNHFLFPIFLFKNKDNAFEPNAEISLFYYCFICLNILTFLWLKYAVIWKFFRFCAWCDGIYTEENMNRFVYNIYSLELFFRGVNRSLSRWMVKYLYIPLGGKNKKYINIWVVFGFWYLLLDFKNIEYAVFAICCCLLMDIEMFVKNIFINKFGEDFNEKIYYRYMKYIACSFYILIMFGIALFGFCLNFDNVKVIFDTIVEKGGYLYFIFLAFILIPNVVMMFFIRDMELENSVALHKKPLDY